MIYFVNTFDLFIFVRSATDNSDLIVDFFDSFPDYYENEMLLGRI